MSKNHEIKEFDIKKDIYQPQNAIRVVTAASLFDGHDVAINIMRRMIQRTGVEVIHLGHDRSVEEVVNTADGTTCRSPRSWRSKPACTRISRTLPAN